MFGQKKIKELRAEIASLDKDVDFWKGTNQISSNHNFCIEEENKELKRNIQIWNAQISDLKKENKRIVDENVRLRTAYNTEVLINDKLRKETDNGHK